MTFVNNSVSETLYLPQHDPYDIMDLCMKGPILLQSEWRLLER